LNTAEISDDICIQFGFELTGYNEMLFDELHIFANVFMDSTFSIPFTMSSWTKTAGTVTTNDNEGHAVLGPGSRMQQPVKFYSVNEDNTLATMFSIQVKGTGTLHVLYIGGERSIEKSIVYTVLTDRTLVEDEWITLRVPVDIDDVSTDSHFFNIENVGNTDIFVDNVYLYVDSRRCPVLQCDDSKKRVFVNGQCELCADYVAGVRPCEAGKKQSGCVVNYEGIKSNCIQECNPVYRDTGGPDDGGSWAVATDAEECTWTCSTGFWFARSGSSSNGPVCNQCTPIDSLRCNVGWYAAACNAQSDAMCLPCSILDRYDSSVVYTTTGNYDKMLYNEIEEVQCKYACAPGQFQYAERPVTGIPMCFPCTSSVCGAEDDGILALRTLDGLQYTSKCSATENSRCKICESDDVAVVFDVNGGAIGDWCNYQCSAGSKPCGTCQWDPAIAIDILHFHPNSTHIPDNIHIPFHQTLMARFTGSVTFESAQFGIKFGISVYISAKVGDDVIGRWDPPGETGVMVSLFPVVQPPALVNMQRSGLDTIIDPPDQSFDTTIEARDFINTANFSRWNDDVVINGASLFLVYEMSNMVLNNISMTSFKIQTVNSTDGCCAPRFANHTETLDPTTLKRCLPCDRAKGLTTTLPTNAHWSNPDDCSWACDPLFEILPNGNNGICNSCSPPSCENGNYWTECNTCVACDKRPANSTFTGPGTTRRDSSSCPIRCDATFYLYNSVNSTECAKCTELTTLDCSNVTKTRGYFFERPCSETEDAMCITCLICGPGWNATTVCGGQNDAVCTRCDTSIMKMPDITIDGGGEWRLPGIDEDYCQWQCASGMQYNPDTNTCFVCNPDTCGVGFYAVSCTRENNYTGCAPCIAPHNAIMVSVGSMSRNNSCMWECTDEHMYNSTINSCVPQPVVQQLKIDSPLPDIHCKGTICDWGFFFDTTFNLHECEAMCSKCPEIPTMDAINADAKIVYIRKSSCEWVCAWPYLFNDGNCVRV
jgi:hypothetical protein